MKRSNVYKPTIEDGIEASGLEILHPGGHALTKRTAEVAGLAKGLNVLDVSCGRGTLALYYAKHYGAHVTGIDILPEMIKTAESRAKKTGLNNLTKFEVGDSQNLPYKDNLFDVVINECAVGIPDDSQSVLNEMMRVIKPGGKIVIHESTWLKDLPKEERGEFSDRYGTTPLKFEEWMHMLEKAGVKDIYSEKEPWSNLEMFWKIRENRDVKHWFSTLTPLEYICTFKRIYHIYRMKGVVMLMRNQQIFYKTLFQGKLGYTLFRGIKRA